MEPILDGITQDRNRLRTDEGKPASREVRFPRKNPRLFEQHSKSLLGSSYGLGRRNGIFESNQNPKAGIRQIEPCSSHRELHGEIRTTIRPVKLLLPARKKMPNAVAQGNDARTVLQRRVIDAKAMRKNIRRLPLRTSVQLVRLLKERPGFARIQLGPQLIKHCHTRSAGIHNLTQELFGLLPGQGVKPVSQIFFLFDEFKT